MGRVGNFIHSILGNGDTDKTPVKPTNSRKRAASEDSSESPGKRAKTTNSQILGERLKEYACGECIGVAYFNKVDLVHHQNSKHKNIKPYVCTHEDCTEDPKQYVRPGDLKRHIDVEHLGLKPYACRMPTCVWAFGHAGHLARHMRDTHGRNELPCPHEGCGEVFVFKGKLTKHMKAKHPVMLTCPECPQKFHKPRALDMHVEVTHMEMYKCPYDACDQVFVWQGQFNKHLTTHNVKHRACPYAECAYAVRGVKAFRAHLRAHSSKK